ncbi:MAG: thioredoxin domain-containing protein [Acidobacteriota bacterium]
MVPTSVLRRTGLMAWLFVLALPLAVPACAQGQAEIEALKKEIAELRAAQESLRKELAEIKAMLRPEASGPIVDAPPDTTIPLAGAQIRGSAAARVVLLEFSDYECPFCGRFARESLPQIARAYIDTGRIRHAFRAFPLEAIHKNAFKAHEAALCAGDQGKFWPMHLLLFGNTRALAPADLVKHAEAVGLDVTVFSRCVESGSKAAAVRADVEAGERLGVRGTPLFLIGTPGANGGMKVSKAISGAQPFAVFQQAIDAVLAGR